MAMSRLLIQRSVCLCVCLSVYTQDIWLEDRSWPWKSGVMMMEASVKSSTNVVRDTVGLEDDKTVGLL